MKRILAALLALLLLVCILIRLGTSEPEPEASTPQTDAGSQPVLPETDPTDQAPPTGAPSATAAPTTDPPATESLFTPPEGALLCRDYFVYDCGEDRFLARSMDADATIYPASITKLFTAWVALQILDPDTVITAGDELDFVGPDSSVAFIRPGHRLTVSMLVEGMLLPSGNDAAYVLCAAAGRAIGGERLDAQAAIACFVARMNEQAAAQGMTGSHFTNPDGYHDPNHYTTCADLLTIARLALENEQIRRYTATSQAEVVYASGHTNSWHNTNLLVDPQSEYYCPDAIGLKTGNTAAAGYCLLSAFEREGRILVIGVFGCDSFMDRFPDSLKLYEFAQNLLT